MQKVEGSSPFSRSSEAPATPGVFAFEGLSRPLLWNTADQLGGPKCVCGSDATLHRPAASFKLKP